MNVVEWESTAPWIDWREPVEVRPAPRCAWLNKPAARACAYTAGMRDERIWKVYVLPNGNAAVFDLYGEQMPAYQDPSPQARACLERAFPRRLWHEWLPEQPDVCRCGRRRGDEHLHGHGDPPLKR